MKYRSALVLLTVAAVSVAVPIYGGGASAYSGAHNLALKKKCHTVTKKVHGKKTKVKVCKKVATPPTVTPTPTPTATQTPVVTGPFTRIDDPLSLNNTYVFFVSSCCGIAGSYRDPQHGLHGFILRNGTYTTIDDPQAVTVKMRNQFEGGTQVQGANGAGEVIGWYGDSTRSFHGFSLFNGAYTTLDDPNAGHGIDQGTYPLSINAGGDVVGTYTDATGLAHGFLLHKGTYTTLDAPQGGTDGSQAQGTQLSSITDSGDAVGFFQDSTNMIHGFLLHAGSYTILDDPKAGAAATRGTMPEGTNNRGDIVGTYLDSAGQSHGFTWKAGTFSDFVVPSNQQPTNPTSIDDAGEIAGFTGQYTSGETHGFLYKP